ncbi:hypothetical protein HP397_03750 [Streptobacillus felis]|uniref:Uncharacterized protein n=1 Tax=Streptobacillus felis TaxID=1384509 RepID=A0A7Z0T8H0_9FUSO|nr:hypothetical protein [Streptobacillus felis]NYV27934.1 hypothetical protein [Streptobacillus felis]
MKKILLLILVLMSMVSFSEYYSIEDIKADGYKLYIKKGIEYAIFSKNGEFYSFINNSNDRSFMKIEDQKFVKEILTKYKNKINFFTVDETNNNIYYYIFTNDLNTLNKIKSSVEKKYKEKKDKLVLITDVVDGDGGDPKDYYYLAFDILLNYIYSEYNIQNLTLRLSKSNYHKLYKAFHRQDDNGDGLIRILFKEFEVVVPFELNQEVIEFLEFDKNNIRIYDGIKKEYINGGDFYEENY